MASQHRIVVSNPTPGFFGSSPGSTFAASPLLDAVASFSRPNPDWTPTLERALEIIGSGAFSATDLPAFELPPVVRDLGSWVFLEGANFHRSAFRPGHPITHLGCWLCEGTQLELIEIPSAVGTIEAGAFQNLTSLVRVDFRAASQLVRVASKEFAGTEITGDLSLPASLYLFVIY
jgi:hypothetical protein